MNTKNEDEYTLTLEWVLYELDLSVLQVTTMNLALNFQSRDRTSYECKLGETIPIYIIQSGREISAILLIVVRDGWKDQKCAYNMGSKRDSFLRKRCLLFCFVHDVLHISLEIMRRFTSVGLSYKDVILFSKIFYVFDVVFVKSNSISCEFSGLNYLATL